MKKLNPYYTVSVSSICYSRFCDVVKSFGGWSKFIEKIYDDLQIMLKDVVLQKKEISVLKKSRFELNASYERNCVLLGNANNRIESLEREVEDLKKILEVKNNGNR